MLIIRNAQLKEKRKTYEWLCLSDTTYMHMGLPDYPEHPVPTWEEFREDFNDFYYLDNGMQNGAVMIIENNLEEIGCLCYAFFHLKPKRAELDIWLNSKRHCGKGFGTEALRLLIKRLNEKYNIDKFIIRPSVKNTRAITAYKKAGFSIADNKAQIIKEYLLPEYIKELGEGDYGFKNTAVLIKEK